MGLQFIRRIRKETQIGLWRVDESIVDLKQRLILNKKEREYLAGLNKNKRNLHWLASRVLLRTMLNTPDFIEMENDEHGKPYLVNFDYEVSLSHSYEYAAAMLSRRRAGIDVERIRPKIKVIAGRFMSPAELEESGTLHSEAKLTVYWCAKEAMYKLYGKKPLSIRENIYIKPFQYEEKGIVQACFVNNRDAPDCHFGLHYERIDGYMMVYGEDDQTSDV